jgi:hypothetical protein
MKGDRNSSNFLNSMNLVRAIALRLVVVFHRRKGVFHRNRQVFHNSFNNYRAKDYRFDAPLAKAEGILKALWPQYPCYQGSQTHHVCFLSVVISFGRLGD